MASDRSVLERQFERVELRPFTLDGFHQRRQRKDRNRRIGAAVVGLLVAGVAIGALLRAFSSGPVPAAEPRDPFLGTWVKTTDAVGGTETMVIRVSGARGVGIEAHDEVAPVCFGTPSMMTGTGLIRGDAELVVPTPTYVCDDGSVPQPQAEELLFERGNALSLTFVLDPEAETLTDNFGRLWRREGGEDPNPDPSASGKMWPQSSMGEAEEAQRLADAGDARYAWQVLSSDARQTEFITRFLREELGWEEFYLNGFPGLYAGVLDGGYYEMLAVRCAGQTNPLYPNDPEGRGCAPTIDEHRYETVIINAEPVRTNDDPSALWVISRWTMLQPFEVQVTGTNYRDDSGALFRREVQQVVPPADADATALLEVFLQARVDGEGAEEYLTPAASRVPLLYATTSGAPYERSEFELVQGPVWPGGWREFEVRLFAEGGSTEVEQSFLVERDEDGRLVVVYGALDPFDDVLTFENGGALPEPYRFLDGEVTFAAAPPWGYSGIISFTDALDTIVFEDPDQDAGLVQRFAVVADPRPVEPGCQQGPAQEGAEALARSLRSDPDLEASEPVAASVGGIEAVLMDVDLAPLASVCEWRGGTHQVLTASDGLPLGLEFGQRMRLYLLDLPEGMSARTLAIAITAPKVDFERVLQAAAPVVESFEFARE